VESAKGGDMKCLVTGGAGFIGSHLCRKLIELGHEVVCIDNLVGGSLTNIQDLEKNFQFIEIDTAIFWQVRELFQAHKFDIVFHNAASKCTVCMDDPLRDLYTNAWGTHVLIKNSIRSGVKKFIHASTGSIADIKSFYGVSKQAGESYLKAFHSYYPEFKYTSLRYHHVYGPSQNAKEGGGVVAIFIRQALNNQPCTIFGDGTQYRHFTHVDDVVKANIFAAHCPITDGQTFNVISQVKVSILKLAKMVWALKDPNHRDTHVYLPKKPGEIMKFTATGEALEALGFEFMNDFNLGLKSTMEWYKNVLQKTETLHRPQPTGI
jgi:UDP-glucose 4-epimerase